VKPSLANSMTHIGSCLLISREILAELHHAHDLRESHGAMHCIAGPVLDPGIGRHFAESLVTRPGFNPLVQLAGKTVAPCARYDVDSLEVTDG
jgi:hypothetical protein